MRLTLRFLAIFAILWTPTLSAQDTAAGYILKCSGVWTAEQNGQRRPLKAGQPVNPGDKLNSNPPTALLGLVLYDGTYLRCPASGKCKQPIEIPARAQTKWTLSAFWGQLSNPHLPPVAFVTSRAAGTPEPPVELHDAVIALNGKKLPLSPVLSAASPVELHLYMEPLSARSGCDAVQLTLPAGDRTAQVSDLEERCAGLYQLSATDAAMEAAYPATVLLVSASQREDAARKLREAAELTAQWQSAGEDEKRTFLRLTLGAIQQGLRPAN